MEKHFERARTLSDDAMLPRNVTSSLELSLIKGRTSVLLRRPAASCVEKRYAHRRRGYQADGPDGRLRAIGPMWAHMIVGVANWAQSGYASPVKYAGLSPR